MLESALESGMMVTALPCRFWFGGDVDSDEDIS
jgi:hypothetical protein